MKLTVGKKIGLGFGLVLALMVSSAIASYFKTTGIRRNQDITFEFRFPTLETVRKLQRDLNYTQVKCRQAILAGTDPVRWKEAKKAFDAAWTEIGKEVASLDDLSAHWSEEDRARLADVKKRLPPSAPPKRPPCSTPPAANTTPSFAPATKMPIW